MIPLRRLALALLLCLALVAGASADPFEVATYADLCKVGTGTDGWFLNATYLQTADIQCPDGANFPRIGLNPGTPFTGTYDGRGYVIRDLYINMPDDWYVGLFGEVEGRAVITNVTLEEFSITAVREVGGLVGCLDGEGVIIENCTVSGTISGGKSYTGGLIGYAEYATITDCHADVKILGEMTRTAGGLIGDAEDCIVTSCSAQGDITSADESVGGLIGYCDGSTITDCHATGDVIGGEWATGGLVGYGYRATVARCYASGNVSGYEHVGGLIGWWDGSTITDCYATGNVVSSGSSTDDCSAGGLVGLWDQYELVLDGHIKNVYSAGRVEAPNLPAEYAGGLIGKIDSDAGVVALNAYWDTETSGQAASAGGAVGKTTAEMKTIATFAGWNIAPAASLTDEVWQIIDGSTYPLFAWQDVPISDQEPVAGFSADPVLGPAPLTVQFTDESTNEPTEWVWQFGDSATSVAQHPTHTYTKPGTYTVSLEAANSAGSDLVTEPDLITVQISDAVTFVGTPTTGGSPLTVRFTVVNGDPTWSYLWSFGDGETSTDQNPVHRYVTRDDTANYTVALSITQNGETETIEKPDYIRIDTVGLDTFTATQQMNIESVVTVGAISSIIAGIIVVVFVL